MEDHRGTHMAKDFDLDEDTQRGRPRSVRRSTSFVKILRSVVLLLVLAIVAAVVLVTFFPGLASVLGLANPFRTETVDRSQPVLLKSIQDLSRYDAAVGNFEVIVDIEDDTSFVPDFLKGERILFVAAGTVDAYVDFSGLDKGAVELSADKSTVTVTLPRAELGEPNLDQKRSYIYSRSRGLVDRGFDAFSLDDDRDVYLKAEKKFNSAAKVSELREQADKNTRAMLTGLFGSLDLRVKFVEQAN